MLSRCCLPVAISILLMPLQAAQAGIDLTSLQKTETEIQSVAEKAMPSVVSLSVKRKNGSGPFHGTGVVITKDGLVLTAGHMVDETEALEVTFLDGRVVHAKVLGVDFDSDIALAMIDERGSYPFSELGDTTTLAPGDMLVSLGHTAGYDVQRKAPVRFGRVYEFDHKGDIRSDCLMAGGDSGGPLFDLQGRVVGVHSRINPKMNENYDAPVEILRKEWDRLIKGERWGAARTKKPFGSIDKSKISEEELAGMNLEQMLHQVSDDSKKNNGRLTINTTEITKWFSEAGMKQERISSMDPQQLSDLFYKALSCSQEFNIPRKSKGPEFPVIAQQNQELLTAMKPALEKMIPSVVSLVDGDERLAMGTIIRADGFILTKHSEIANAVALKARLSDGRELPAVELQSFPDHDLALLKVAADALPAVTLTTQESLLPLGKFVFTPGTSTRKPMMTSGVVSVKERPLTPARGYLGLKLRDGTDSIEVNEVTPGSPAFAAGLQKGDQILAADDRTFKKAFQFNQFITSQKPAAKVQLKIRRATDEKSVEITLSRPPVVAEKREAKKSGNASLGAEISQVRSGFPMVFQTDQSLNAKDCGSVVMDLGGQIVGVNIARNGRTDSYAIPARVVADLLKSVNFDALSKKAPQPTAGKS